MCVARKYRHTLLLFLLLSLFLTAVTAQNLPYSSVKSTELFFLSHATYLRAVEPQKNIHFTVWLTLRNKKELDKQVNNIYDPKTKYYQQFLQSETFQQSYAPSKTTKNKVANYFKQQGMQVKIEDNRVEVRATAKQIETALQVKLNYYKYQNQFIYANATAPKLKMEIAEAVSQITGLSNVPLFHPPLHKRPVLTNQKLTFKPHEIHLLWDTFKPSAQPTTTSFAGFTGITLRTALNLASVLPVNGTEINGAGQTLVIIDACGTNSAAQILSDANLYNAANALPLFTPSNFTIINPNGTPFTVCASPDADWDNEIALDIEASHTIAPGANTVLVLAPSDASPLYTAIDDVTTTLINNNYTIAGFPNAYVVSNSWGETESNQPALETVLERAAAHGISFNFSTGDCGDQTYTSTWPCSAQGVNPTLEFPASSAFVTAVGGTSLFVDNNWNYAFEHLWGSHLDSGFYAGTTGGISQFYGPVAWQSAIAGFTAGGYTGTVGQYNKRALPDVSMLADPYTGLTIYEGGTSFVYGGTSLACPLFSGTLVLLNQARMLLNGGMPRPIGQAAPYFYVNNTILLRNQALRLVVPPHTVLEGARLPPSGAPISAFKIRDDFYGYDLTFGWDSSLTLQPENQFWNDGVGVGSIYIPNFLTTMANI